MLSGDPLWRGSAESNLASADFRMISKNGFQHVRINVSAFRVMDDQLELDSGWLARLDDIVSEATEASLTVIIDQHDYRECAQDADDCRRRLVSFWGQVAPRYSNAPESVMFELLNEPRGAVTPEIWNELLVELLDIVRQTNPDRIVIIGPPDSNHLNSLDKLRLPDSDRNIMVTFHYYTPFSFTHQGADWTSTRYPAGSRWNHDQGRDRLRRDFRKVDAWSRLHDRPILLGEFGVINLADEESRRQWTEAVAREAERHGFSWTYWNFNGSSFGTYDRHAREWLLPIRDALIPDVIDSENKE